MSIADDIKGKLGFEIRPMTPDDLAELRHRQEIRTLVRGRRFGQATRTAATIRAVEAAMFPYQRRIYTGVDMGKAPDLTYHHRYADPTELCDGTGWVRHHRHAYLCRGCRSCKTPATPHRGERASQYILDEVTFSPPRTRSVNTSSLEAIMRTHAEYQTGIRVLDRILNGES